MLAADQYVEDTQECCPIFPVTCSNGDTKCCDTAELCQVDAEENTLCCPTGKWTGDSKTCCGGSTVPVKCKPYNNDPNPPTICCEEEIPCEYNENPNPSDTSQPIGYACTVASCPPITHCANGQQTGINADPPCCCKKCTDGFVPACTGDPLDTNCNEQNTCGCKCPGLTCNVGQPYEICCPNDGDTCFDRDGKPENGQEPSCPKGIVYPSLLALPPGIPLSTKQKCCPPGSTPYLDDFQQPQCCQDYRWDGKECCVSVASFVYTAANKKQACCKWNEYGYTKDNGDPACCAYALCNTGGEGVCCPELGGTCKAVPSTTRGICCATDLCQTGASKYECCGTKKCKGTVNVSANKYQSCCDDVTCGTTTTKKCCGDGQQCYVGNGGVNICCKPEVCTSICCAVDAKCYKDTNGNDACCASEICGGKKCCPNTNDKCYKDTDAGGIDACCPSGNLLVGGKCCSSTDTDQVCGNECCSQYGTCYNSNGGAGGVNSCCGPGGEPFPLDTTKKQVCCPAGTEGYYDASNQPACCADDKYDHFHRCCPSAEALCSTAEGEVCCSLAITGATCRQIGTLGGGNDVCCTTDLCQTSASAKECCGPSNVCVPKNDGSNLYTCCASGQEYCKNDAGVVFPAITSGKQVCCNKQTQKPYLDNGEPKCCAKVTCGSTTDKKCCGTAELCQIDGSGTKLCCPTVQCKARTGDSNPPTICCEEEVPCEWNENTNSYACTIASCPPITHCANGQQSGITTDPPCCCKQCTGGFVPECSTNPLDPTCNEQNKCGCKCTGTICNPGLASESCCRNPGDTCYDANGRRDDGEESCCPADDKLCGEQCCSQFGACYNSNGGDTSLDACCAPWTQWDAANNQCCGNEALCVTGRGNLCCTKLGDGSVCNIVPGNANDVCCPPNQEVCAGQCCKAGNCYTDISGAKKCCPSDSYVYTVPETLKQVCCKWNQYGYTDGKGDPKCCDYGFWTDTTCCTEETCGTKCCDGICNDPVNPTDCCNKEVCKDKCCDHCNDPANPTGCCEPDRNWCKDKCCPTDQICKDGTTCVDCTADTDCKGTNKKCNQIPADIYFLADNTGSMKDHIKAVADNAKLILDSLKTSIDDLYTGGGRYRDRKDAFVFENTANLAAGTIGAQNAINAWAASGGGDEPEGQLYALWKLATPGAYGWRSSATKVILWFGDAPGHNPICIGYVSSAVCNANTAAELCCDGGTCYGSGTVKQCCPAGRWNSFNNQCCPDQQGPGLLRHQQQYQDLL
ncbi:PEP-CTERM domain [Chlorella sorokiniana]|uniref:PEP-CTERM domain n=1 Tax=Chlorella sorokiniana TaxID=3076 RepID=A0A2P6TM21_CHLSO|nr:PEP-CTERM domain [Chlorella sorokiniana]|eukprot:PRW45345.1 PEP-CTERM domain [Chlorella sorokiniana]